MQPQKPHLAGSYLLLSHRFFPLALRCSCQVSAVLNAESVHLIRSVHIDHITPLWETMRRKQVTQYQLLKNGLDNKTLDTLKKNRNITLSTLEKLCQMLDCTPNDVVQFIPDDKK